MFGSTAMGVDHEAFRARACQALKKEKGVKPSTPTSRPDDLKELVKRYKAVYKEHVGDRLPSGPQGTAHAASIMAVFN